MATEHKRQSDSQRGALYGTVVLLVVVVVVVFALPGPSPRKYPDRIPVRLWHMWTAEWKDVVEDIVDRFNESQDVYEVLPLSVPGTAADSKFLLAVAGGDPPDVMAQWNPVIPKWAESGLIVPLNELMTAEEWTEFKRTAYPAVQKIGMYQGNLYGVTTGLNAWACYVRLDHLREAGLDMADFPDTLDGLVAWGDSLHRRNDQGDLVRMGYLPLQWIQYAPAFGGGFYDWDTGEVLLDTPENLRALSFLTGEREKLGFDTVVRFQSGLTTGVGNVEWPFISGSYTITVDGQWRVEQLAKFAPDLEYDTAAIPPPDGGKKNAGWVNGNFMIIPVGAKQPEGAWEFIKFWSGLAEPERAAEFYTWGGWLPLSPAIANAPIYRKYVEDHPQFQTFLDILPSEDMQPLPPVPYQVYLFDRIVQNEDSAVRGSVTPEEAIERLKKEIGRELAVRKEFGYDD
ncbi:MAG: ABC transporter substrate-binding protein [bacterium]|nr:ABC transporter substrate-binding protein [bacterium]